MISLDYVPGVASSCHEIMDSIRRMWPFMVAQVAMTSLKMRSLGKQEAPKRIITKVGREAKACPGVNHVDPSHNCRSFPFNR